MPLISALQIGRSALSASQVAIAITGNNFANAATPGYNRQIVGFAPTRDARFGNAFIGRGVEISGINRQVDAALQARLWDGISRQASAGVDMQLLSQVEATLNELTDNDLSTELSEFFGAWSGLGNNPGDSAARSLVVQQGRTLAGFIQRTRSNLTEMRVQVDRQLEASVSRADQLLSGIASLNTSIVTAEAGSAVANALRDQRDALVTELSAMMGVTVVEQPSGTIDVLAGSLPLVLNGSSRGLELRRQSSGGTGGVGGAVEVSIGIREPRERIEVATGQMGALMAQRSELVDDTLERLDEVAAQLIFQVNRLHSQGYSSTPTTSVRGTRAVASTDTTRALNDPANQTLANLPFHAENGGFLVTVRNTDTGSLDTVRIEVDLDGLDSTGTAGYGDDTSVADIAGALGGVPNLSATVNADGTISINAASGYEVSFSEDSSGALAVLGINTYFTGEDAGNIGVRQELLDEPGRLNTGRMIGGQPTDNGIALAIAQLVDQANPALGGSTIPGAWGDAVVSIGLRTDAASTHADATTLVRESLEAQRSAVSGVSVDEESINLLTYQRQYQGAARFIAAVDEMTQILIQLI